MPGGGCEFLVGLFLYTVKLGYVDTMKDDGDVDKLEEVVQNKTNHLQTKRIRFGKLI